MSKKVVIAGACRTAIGKMGGGLSTTPAADLGAIVIKEALRRAGVPADQVSEVLMGCVIQAGLGQNVARQASIKAGLPVEVPAVTINVVCGSGLNSVNMAADMILAGDADIVVAGGTENMSLAPFCLPKARFGYRMNNGVLVDCMVNDALWDAFNNYHMIRTADNVAAKWGLTREEIDEFAAWSQTKCAKAQEEGKFKDEIVPVTVHQKKQDVIVDKDEGPRGPQTAADIAKLRTINPDGVTTAANASGINDGAAAMVLGPVAATRKVMAKTGLTIDDFDLYEANEAFGAQSVAVGKELHFDMNKLNVNGGAIALGHPVGASGARILTTLLYEMQKRNSKRGLATLCIGGGMGCATVVERYEEN